MESADDSSKSNVYLPTGMRKIAAYTFMPVKAVTTALPPSSSWLPTRMFVLFWSDLCAIQRQHHTRFDHSPEGKHHENNMGETTVSCVDDLEIGVASRCILLDFACQDREHKNLHRRSCCVPEWTSNSVRVRDLKWSARLCITTYAYSLYLTAIT